MKRLGSPCIGSGADAVHAVIRIEALPAAPLAAAARFYAGELATIEGALAAAPASLAVVFPSLHQGHRGWIREAIAALARAHAPVRVNGVVAGLAATTTAIIAWLETAPGITGQLFVADGQYGESAS